jgi:MAP/microtubule affinity-regulating kinase
VTYLIKLSPISSLRSFLLYHHHHPRPRTYKPSRTQYHIHLPSYMFPDTVQFDTFTHPWLQGFISSQHCQPAPTTIDGLPSTHDLPERPRLIAHNDIHHDQISQLSDPNVQHTSSQAPASLSSPSMSPAAAFLSAFSSPTVRASPPDAEGITIGGYTLGPVIGHGGFSTIRRAYSSSGGTVAAKIVLRSDLAKQDNSALARKRLDHEAAIWASLSHEHILPLFSSVHTPYADYFFTLLCPSGSLFDIMKRNGTPALPLEDLGVVFGQVVRGLRYLHEVAGLVHRDIKLENVLVDEMGVCRICDFGTARKICEVDEEPSAKSHTSSIGIRQHHNLNTPKHRNSAPLAGAATHTPPTQVFQPGSLPYQSPELLRPTGSSPAGPNPAQDIWALGVMLYVMLTGRLPFFDSFELRLQMKILQGESQSELCILQYFSLVLDV